MIDAGAGRSVDTILGNMELCSFEPQRLHTLVLTHCHIDHIGGAAKVKERTGCKVVAHELDSKAIEEGDDLKTAAGWYGMDHTPVMVDEKITGNKVTERIRDKEFTFLHTPGHTPGSMVVLVETKDGLVLFGQDIHGPFDPDFGSDISAWRESMRTLLTLNADILCEGHFGTFRSKKKVRSYIEGYLSQYN